MSEPYDARIPQLGFIGRQFRAGNIVLMTINPGGGRDAYSKTDEDRRLIPMIDKARSEPFNEEYLEEVFDLVAQNMRTWNLWRIVSPTLKACGLNQSQVAIVNWCPFRTRHDAMPLAADMTKCRDLVVLPMLKALRPTKVIALGKKVGEPLTMQLGHKYRIFTVPRTIGDSRVSPEAEAVLQKIKQEASR
jgi:hypothetical protein